MARADPRGSASDVMVRTTGPIRWVIVGALALSGGCADRTPPVISDVIVTANPSGRVPEAARATLTTDEPAQIAVEITAGETTWVRDLTAEYHVGHSVLVLGLRPAQTHQIVFVAADEAGNSARSSTLEITTPPLPNDFPPLTVARSEPDRMEPGVTLFSVYRRTEVDPGTNFGLLLAVNAAGEVVWYYRSDERITDARRLRNGNILYTGGAKTRPAVRDRHVGSPGPAVACGRCLKRRTRGQHSGRDRHLSPRGL